MKFYNPSYFNSNDFVEAVSFMNQFSFATVISSGAVSHLPLVAQKCSEGIKLIGHLARANPQWKDFSSGSVTCLFHGPHTFIAPAWYQNGGVPTWNYSVVHATGTVKLIEDFEGLIRCLRLLNDQTEKNYPSGWNFTIPEDLAGDRLSRAIMGFEITVSDLQFKKKLSQNKTPQDRAGVLNGLAHRTDEQSKQVLKDMLVIIDQNGNLK